MQLDSVITNETEWLIYYLWKKESSDNTIRFNFKIPDTVTYKVGNPYTYFFSSKHDLILKKNDRKLSKDYVLEKFL